MAKKSPKPLLDLHGVKTDEVFDALESFLMRHSSKPKVYIMTGKGTGAVKAKVIEYLKLARYPYSVYRDDLGHTNDGILIVHTND